MRKLSIVWMLFLLTDSVRCCNNNIAVSDYHRKNVLELESNATKTNTINNNERLNVVIPNNCQQQAQQQHQRWKESDNKIEEYRQHQQQRLQHHQLLQKNYNSNSTRLCNGFSNLCNKTLNQVLFAAGHNGNAALLTGYPLLPNHYRSLEASLRRGYRGIQVDITKCRNNNKFNNDDDNNTTPFHLIHGFCVLGQRKPTRVFRNIMNFLDINPNEIVFIVIEIDYQRDIVFNLTELYSMFNSIPGFTSRMYSHPDRLNPFTSSPTSWPTLSELIDADQRIVLFVQGGQQCRSTASSSNSSSCPNGFHDWFAYAGETEYRFNSIAEIQNATSSCTITRGGNGRLDFFGVNNFLVVPRPAATALVLNTKDLLKQRLDDCSYINNGMDVNYLLVDFWQSGDVIQVVNEYNSRLT